MAKKGQRRAGPSRFTGWLWWRHTDRAPTFLPRQPKHSETGAIEQVRKDLIERGEDVSHLPRRRQRHFSRTVLALILRWRYFVTTGVLLTLIVSLVASTMVTFRDAFNDEGKLPSQSAPTLAELNQSISQGKRYITALYKPLKNGQAVQSEASGIPLRAYFRDEHQWVLLGEDKQVCPSNRDSCLLTSSVESSDAQPKSDRYSVTFNTKAFGDALNLDVKVNWYSTPETYQIVTKPTKVLETVDLWLDNTKLATYVPGKHPTTKRAFKDSEQSRLRMLRFTVRHATQEAYLYWSTYGRDPKKAKALGKFLKANGYTPGYDLRAPLFNSGSGVPDDMPVNDTAYPDCKHIAGSTVDSYAYRSKVCLYEDAYIASGERDPFLQGWEALTVLERHKDPDHNQPTWGWWMQGDTPAEVSKHLRGQWNRSGAGIPKCTPFRCAELSSIRTSIFGALETELGFRYGDKKATKFADAAASVIIRTQVQVDGGFTVDDGKVYGRPGNAGSYMSAWNTSYEFTQPSTPKLPVAIALKWKDAHPTPLEFDGKIPSNSETSFDALGFLEKYRCAKYHVGCLSTS